ncbi:response regulator [Deltaproteobacteria bacterium TL4]
MTPEITVKLLIVDDEPVILKTLALLFEPEGLKVTCTTSPHEALDLMREDLFQIVLCDIKMPEMLGSELLRELKKINPLCQVIMMTGYSSLNYVIECLGHGACDYFTKPFVDVSILQKAVHDVETRIVRWHQVMQDTFLRG